MLGCLALVIRHLNMHEATRLEGDGSLAAPPNQGSLHALLQKPLYDFYVVQLRSLPDTSARVNALIRLTAFYLQPWTVHALAPTAVAKGDAAATAASPPPALVTGGGTSMLAAPHPNPEHWAYAGFVQANFLLYVRLLRTVANPSPSPNPNPNPNPILIVTLTPTRWRARRVLPASSSRTRPTWTCYSACATSP